MFYQDHPAWKRQVGCGSMARIMAEDIAIIQRKDDHDLNQHGGDSGGEAVLNSEYILKVSNKIC